MGTRSELRRLVALEEIRALLVAYARELDAGRIKEFAQLFAKDAEWIGPRGKLKGRQAIRTYFAAKPADDPASHVVTNVAIDLNRKGSRAKVRSEFLYVTRSGADGGSRIDTTGHYEDVVKRDGNGWRFTKRLVVHDIPADDALTAEDRLAVQDLIASYARCLDTADVAGWVDNFIPDGVLESLNGTVVGHDELRHWMTTLLEFGEVGLDPPIMVHVVGLPQIRGTRERCVAKTYGIVLDYDAERNIRVPIVGYYLDACVPDGDRWRFERRVIIGALDSAGRRIRPPYEKPPAG